MKLIACLLACLAAAGCQRRSGDTPPPVDQAYRTDIDSLCNAITRSGAVELPRGDRTLAIAQWLSSALQTKQAHEYLIRIQPLTGTAKADALDAEARHVGLTECPLAAEWRTPGEPTPARSTP